jgi:hypothetical protein
MMRLSIIAWVMVISLSAFGLYKVKYQVQALKIEIAETARALEQEKQSLHVVAAEWAYLNRPDRLRDLATVNFDRLGLLPLQPEQFGHPQEVAYPSLVLPEITQTFDVQGETEGTAP